MAGYIVIKLPEGYNVDDIENFDFKATSKSGEELLNSCGYSYSTFALPVGATGDSFTAERTVPCVQLNVNRKATQETVNPSGQTVEAVQATRKASVATKQLPSVHIQSGHFEHDKQLHHEVSKQQLTLAVTQEEREAHAHSLPETKAASNPIQISRPHSDTDVTKLSTQVQGDVMSPIQKSNTLHIKGGEKIVLEEPYIEGLSLTLDEYKDLDEKYDPYPSMVPEESATPMFFIPEEESPTTPVVGHEASPFLMLEGPTEAVTGMPPRKLVGSSVDLTYHLRHEYQNQMFHSEIVFPRVKPSVLPGTDDQFPDVFVEYSCKPEIWPLHNYTENPMRYNVGELPKKSLNNVYYSLDEAFAFKEEISKVLLIHKKEIFQKVTQLDPTRFVPIIAYLHDGRLTGTGAKFGYQIMEYYKDGSIHDVFKVTVNTMKCNCFLEIYHQMYIQYNKIKQERDLYRCPYLFNVPHEYRRKLAALDRQVSMLSDELENLVRNFNTAVNHMLKAVECLHSHGLVHRDIKPHNFLVKRIESCRCNPLILCSCEQPGFRVLLGDYDFVSFATAERWNFSCTKCDYSKNTKRGTVGYRPIELNFDNEGEEICDPKSDIYSLGVSILEILSGSNWDTCENEIDDLVQACLSPLYDKCKESANVYHFQDRLSETYITLQEIGTNLQKKGIINNELSEVNQNLILTLMCTENYGNVTHSVEKLRLLASKQCDGLKTAVKVVIKAKHVDGHCAKHNWEVVESQWICKIIQQCVSACPQQRPSVRQLLQS